MAEIHTLETRRASALLMENRQLRTRLQQFETAALQAAAEAEAARAQLEAAQDLLDHARPRRFRRLAGLLGVS